MNYQMDDNVLQKKTQSILTIKQKTRHSLAAQHFMKGAQNFLIEYNSQIENIIDIDNIKKEYEDQFKDRVSVTIKRAQEANKHEQTVKGTLTKVALIGGFAMITVYALYRKLSNVVNDLKDGLFGDIVKYADQKMTSFDQVHNWVKGMIRFDFTKVIVKLTDTLVFSVIFPGIRLLVDLIDDLFNGNTYEEQNTFEFILNQLAATAAQRVASKSTLFNILEIFGITINKAVTHKPDLHKFLKLGKEAVQALKEGNIETQEAYKNQGTYEERRAGWFTYETVTVTDDFRNRIKDSRGLNVDTGTDAHKGGMQWNAVQDIFATWNRQAVEKYAGAYADSLRTDILHSSIDPYLPIYRDQANRIYSSMRDWEVDMYDDVDDAMFSDLVYTGWQPYNMLNKAKEILDTQATQYIKTNPLYNKLIEKYNQLNNNLENAGGCTAQNWADIHYFHAVVVSFIFGAKEAEALNNSFYNNYHVNRDFDGKSFLQIRAEGLEIGLPKVESVYSQTLKSIYGGAITVDEFVNEMTKNGGIFDKWGRGEDIFLRLTNEYLYKQFKIGKLLSIVRVFASDRNSYNQLMHISSYVSSNTRVTIMNVNQTQHEGYSIRDNKWNISNDNVIENMVSNQVNADLCIRINQSYKTLYKSTKRKREQRKRILDSIQQKMKYFLPIVRKKTAQERVQQRLDAMDSDDIWSDTQAWMDAEGLVVD